MSINLYSYSLMLLGSFVAIEAFASLMRWRTPMRRFWNRLELVTRVAAKLGFVRAAAFNEMSALYMDAGVKVAAERSRAAAAWQARDYLLGRVQELEAAMEDTQRMARRSMDREWLASLAGDLERSSDIFVRSAQREEGGDAKYFVGKQMMAVETASRIRRFLDAKVGG